MLAVIKSILVMQVVARTIKSSCWIVISVCMFTDKGSTDVCSPDCVPSLRMGYTTSDIFIPEGKMSRFVRLKNANFGV